MNAILLFASAVGALNLYALVLVLIRAPTYRVPVYRPMVLNIALSLAPALVLGGTLLVLMVMVSGPSGVFAAWSILLAGGLIWLVLLPNSAYLITELNFSHRVSGDPVPLWFDIVATLALALSGIMNTLLNVLVGQVIFVVVWAGDRTGGLTEPVSWAAAGGVLFLSTVGIYLGRYLRFNSWDLAHPARFFRKLVTHFIEPGRFTEAVGFCVLHTVLLGILYGIVVAPLLAHLTL